MIGISTIETSGWFGAIYGMRNPMNSWSKMDSSVCNTDLCANCIAKCDGTEFTLGAEDAKLCKKLIKSGADHRKFLRMIHCQFDVFAPLYWYKEMDTYKVGTVCNSCSTMHKITAQVFELDDFSYEKLGGMALDSLKSTVCILNYLRADYLESKDKDIWYQIIQLLPSSYMQNRTYDMSYETLYSIYQQRQNHKLEEWKEFCKWIRRLPYMNAFLNEED